MSGSPGEELANALAKNPEWWEVDGDDWAEQATEDGSEFEDAIEVRIADGSGYSSRYFATLAPNDMEDEDDDVHP